MSALDRVGSEYLQFHIGGVDVEFKELPWISSTAREVIEKEFGKKLPDPKPRKLSFYEINIADLNPLFGLTLFHSSQKGSIDYRNEGILWEALGVTLFAIGILGTTLSHSPIPVFCLAGSVFAFLPGGCYLSEWERLEKMKKILERLKPEAQQYVENFVSYYQTHGPELQLCIANALRAECKKFLEGSRQSLPRNLESALGEIKRVNKLVELGEPGKKTIYPIAPKYHPQEINLSRS